MIRARFDVAALACALATAALGCGSEKDREGAKSRAEVLDPGEDHYGKSYAEWNTEWFKWIFELPLDEDCHLPVDDATGKYCDSAQGGDVFFLAGSIGINAAVVERDECRAPTGKALFFPIMNTVADNGGVPEDQQLSDEENRASAEAVLAKVKPEKLFASVDGVAISNLAAFKADVSEFSYDVPAEPNFYSCVGAPGVMGRVGPSYAGGYYIMLAPLSAGTHELHFGLDQPEDMWSIDITYRLEVE